MKMYVKYDNGLIYVKLRCVSETQIIQSDQIFCRLDIFISSAHNPWPFGNLAELAMLQTIKTNWLSGLFVQWILMKKLITNIQIIF